MDRAVNPQIGMTATDPVADVPGTCHQFAMCRTVKFLMAAFPSSLLVASAGAILPATQEQLVCGASSMILGEVLETSSRDCRLGAITRLTNCEPKDLADLTIRVVDELPNGGSKLRASDVFEASASVRNGSVGAFPDDGTLDAGQSGNTLTDAHVREAFEGTRFFFGIWPEVRGPRAWVKMWKVEGPAQGIWEHTCPRSPWRPKQNVR
jgi:hypothetical protein